MKPLKTIQVQKSEDKTRKYLFELEDGNRIETVYMDHPYGGSVCVSSQAGCSMGCAFCASGLRRKARDLRAEEIARQVFAVWEDLKREASDSPRLSHAVVMGTGEPFDNYENVIGFCDQISDQRLIDGYFKANALEKSKEERFQAIAARHITVSTCGLVPKIRAFSETEKRYNLAISLHAPEDGLRNRLMPVNRKYPLSELIPAAKEYCEKTNRRITFEYILLSEVNDSDAQAEALSALLSGEERFYVNLIPYNPVNEFGFRGSEKSRALAFYDVLMKHGVKATLRKERGTDIAAACGQLRLKSESEK